MELFWRLWSNLKITIYGAEVREDRPVIRRLLVQFPRFITKSGWETLEQGWVLTLQLLLRQLKWQSIAPR